MTRFFLAISTLLLVFASVAQDSTGKKKQLSLTFYTEPYYAYDFNRPADNNRPSFIYSYNRHNEINLNLAFVKLAHTSEKTRANMALATGTYMNANYTAEPGVLRQVYEANAGIRMLRNHKLWLDAGVLPSHIGFESAHSPSCWTLTRSMVADNSPYFEAGVRLGYESRNQKLYIAALALNGWQRITRIDGNSKMSWGTQLTWKLTGNSTFNYSTFLGTDKPDSNRLWRHYHNLYAILQLSDKLGATVGIDIGAEQAARNNTAKNFWFSPVAILRLTPVKYWSFAMRGEYFSDVHGVIIPGFGSGGFRSRAYSVNVDRKIGDHCLWRTELKIYHSPDPVFSRDGVLSKDCMLVTTAISFSLTDPK